MVVDWWEVRWILQMKQNFVAKFVQLLKHWLCDVQSGIVVGKNWAFSADQYWLLAFQFSVHLINLLSILLRCNVFSGIQKIVVDQMGSRPPNSNLDHFFGCFLLELLLGPATELIITGCQYKIHFSLYFTILWWNGLLLLYRIREDYTSRRWFF